MNSSEGNVHEQSGFIRAKEGPDALDGVRLTDAVGEVTVGRVGALEAGFDSLVRNHDGVAGDCGARTAGSGGDGRVPNLRAPKTAFYGFVGGKMDSMRGASPETDSGPAAPELREAALGVGGEEERARSERLCRRSKAHELHSGFHCVHGEHRQMLGSTSERARCHELRGCERASASPPHRL